MHSELDLPTAELFDKICDEFEDVWDDQAVHKIEKLIGDVGEQYRFELATELIRVDIELRHANFLKIEAQDYSEWVEDPNRLVEEFKAAQRATASEYFDGLSDLSDVADLPKPPRLPGLNVIGLVGRGFLGTVWAALDDSIIRQPYAVKVFSLGENEQDLRQRFLDSLKKFVNLRHPNVASIVSVGQLKSADTSGNSESIGASESEGKIYCVSELVSGISFIDYCQNLRLSWEERLELLLQVCDGVGFAHSLGLSHLCLNPNNILVSAQAGERSVAITDFGIGGVLGTMRMNRMFQEMTSNHEVMRSAVYLAPEQVFQSDEPPTACADVYALGMLLSNILVDPDLRDPRGLRRIEIPIGDFLKDFIENGSRNPLANLNQASPGAQVRIARRCGEIDLQKYRSQVLPDFEAIVEKSTKRNPSERYSTVEEFAADLRQLTGVRTPSPSIRFSNWMAEVGRRQARWGLVVCAVLVIAIAGIAWAWASWFGAESQSKNQSEVLEAEAEFASAVGPLVAGNARAATEVVVVPATVLESQIRMAVQRVPYECIVYAASQPSTGSEETEEIERVEKRASQLENVQKKLRLLDRRMDRRLVHQARFLLGFEWMRIGQWNKSEIEFEAVLESCMREHGPTAPETLRVQTQIGFLCLLRGELLRCKQIFAEVVALSGDAQETENDFLCSAYYGTGEYYLRLGELQESETWFQNAYTASYQRTGQLSFESLHAATKIGECLLGRKRFRRAAEHLTEVYANASSQFGRDADLTEYAGELLRAARNALQ